MLIAIACVCVPPAGADANTASERVQTLGGGTGDDEYCAEFYEHRRNLFYGGLILVGMWCLCPCLSLDSDVKLTRRGERIQREVEEALGANAAAGDVEMTDAAATGQEEGGEPRQPELYA